MTAPVDMPDWRALPGPGARAEARFAVLWGFVRRVALGVGVVLAVWGGAIALFDLPVFVMPGPWVTFQAFLAQSDKLFAALAFGRLTVSTPSLSVASTASGSSGRRKRSWRCNRSAERSWRSG